MKRVLQQAAVPVKSQSGRLNFLRALAVVAFYKSDYDTHAGQYDHDDFILTHSAPPFPYGP